MIGPPGVVIRAGRPHFNEFRGEPRCAWCGRTTTNEACECDASREDPLVVLWIADMPALAYRTINHLPVWILQAIDQEMKATLAAEVRYP